MELQTFQIVHFFSKMKEIMFLFFEKNIVSVQKYSKNFIKCQMYKHVHINKPTNLMHNFENIIGCFVNHMLLLIFFIQSILIALQILVYRLRKINFLHDVRKTYLLLCLSDKHVYVPSFCTGLDSMIDDENNSCCNKDTQEKSPKQNTQC